jgi:hypothetical protein
VPSLLQRETEPQVTTRRAFLSSLAPLTALAAVPALATPPPSGAQTAYETGRSLRYLLGLTAEDGPISTAAALLDRFSVIDMEYSEIALKPYALRLPDKLLITLPDAFPLAAQPELIAEFLGQHLLGGHGGDFARGLIDG